MALDFQNLLKLAKATAKADRSTPIAYSFGEKKYDYSQLNEALRQELNALAPDYRTYKINQNTIFALLEQTIDDVIPKKVLEAYGQFADIKTFKQGEKPVFVQKITTASKRRAKQFIGKVGLAGLYEAFRLDGRTYEVTTDAVGGAAQIGFEEFLDGKVDFAYVLDILLEGLDECIYKEIEAQLVGATASLTPGSNYIAFGGFDEASMDKLLGVADSYGKAAIYCTFEFAATMWPSDTRMSDAMKENRFTGNGYVATYKNHQVIVLPQSYDDETNTHKTIDPSYAYIIPVGSEKPVKIAFEGSTIVDEYTNYDRSKEVQAYKKMGVRAVFSPAICVYKNSNLHR